MEQSTVKRYLPWVVATALFMEQLDSTIVNTAVPVMAASLNVSPLSLKGVVASYILSLAVGIPVSGWMADRFGTRRVFAWAVALFTFSSVLCGLSVNVPMLVGARILQGIGAAMMMPVGRLSIIRTYPKSELLVAMNFVIIPALIGPLLGPTIGGLIVHWLSWRDIFFVNIPVGIAAQWLIHRHMPDYRGESQRSFDLVGFVLFGTGTALLSWLLEVFGEHRIDGTMASVLCAIAILLLLGLVARWAWRRKTGKPHKKAPRRRRSTAAPATLPAEMPPRPDQWSLEFLQAIEWKRLEALVAAYFREKSFRTESLPAGTGGSMDLKLFVQGSADPFAMVRCKAWQPPVGVAALEELLALMGRQQLAKGIFVSTAGYSAEASEFAATRPVNLISAEMLYQGISALPAEAQQRLLEVAGEGDYATPTCPRCDIKLVARTGKAGVYWGCRNYPGCKVRLGMAPAA